MLQRYEVFSILPNYLAEIFPCGVCCVSMFKERLSRRQSHACMDYAEAMVVFEAKPQRARCPVGAVGIVGAVGAVPTRGGSGPRTKSGTQRAVRICAAGGAGQQVRSSHPVRAVFNPCQAGAFPLPGTASKPFRYVPTSRPERPRHRGGQSPLYSLYV